MFEPLSGELSLEVMAPTPFDEIFVIDGGFNRVTRGLGRLTATLPPGLYTIKFKSGDTIREETVLLNKATVTIDRRDPQSKGLKERRPVPESLGERATLAPGPPSTVFVDVRDIVSETIGGVRLVSEAGEVVCTASDLTRAPVKVKPLVYRLELPAGRSGTLSLCLPVLAGWRTRIWWPENRQALTGSDAVLTMRLAMSPAGSEDDGESDAWLNKAMSALLAERRAVPRALLKEMPDAVRMNPMLLLCCCHMLLLQEPVPHEDWLLCADLVKVLTETVPDHPDVRVLGLYASKDAGERPRRLEISWPPMLWRTWRLLDQPFLRDLAVISPGSMADEAARRTVTSSGWLMWKALRRTATT